MIKKCPKCSLRNSKNARSCVKCLFDLREVSSVSLNVGGRRAILKMITRRAIICFLVCIMAIAGFYLSLVFSAKSLSFERQAKVEKAIDILAEKGFSDEVYYLRNFTVFRGSDNWLNASVAKENAYAATNYPFEIMTIYPDFFTYTNDDIERAAIILHEAKHLQGFDEKAAYEFVWKNRKQLGWTKDKYRNSVVWSDVRKQTREYAPNLFICDFNEYGDCTK